MSVCFSSGFVDVCGDYIVVKQLDRTSKLGSMVCSSLAASAS